MDFIERIFGVSPDGGNGTLEFLYVVSIAAVVMFISYELRRRRTSRRTPSAINKHADLQHAVETPRIPKT